MPNTITLTDVVVSYGDHEFSVGELPHASVVALIHRGMTHFLGNEQSSKVTAWKKAQEKGTDTVAGRVPSDDEIDTYRDSKVDAAIAALRAGTIGVRESSGPKASPREGIVRDIAKLEVIAILIERKLVKEGTKAVKNDKGFAFGDQTVTFETLVDRRTEKFAERLGKEADEELARRARVAAKAAKSVAGSSDDELL